MMDFSHKNLVYNHLALATLLQLSQNQCMLLLKQQRSALPLSSLRNPIIQYLWR